MRDLKNDTFKWQKKNERGEAISNFPFLGSSDAFKALEVPIAPTPSRDPLVTTVASIGGTPFAARANLQKYIYPDPNEKVGTHYRVSGLQYLA